MSAIWGAINIAGGQIPQEYVELFHKAYEECVIDSWNYVLEENVLMGCELQCFTPQSAREQLPVKDEEKQSFFTADVYIDNREKVLQDPIFAGEDKEQITDSSILLRLIQTHGIDYIKEIHGSYTFVYYDKKNNKAYITADHMCNRCLYYAFEKDILFFSTLIEPIALINKGKFHPDQNTFQDFLGIEDLRVYLDYEATIFAEIKHVVAAEILSFDQDGMHRHTYWDPLKGLRIQKGKTDETYQKELHELFGKAVRQSLRTDGEVGIFLSGGLDSTSVACMAAPMLKEKGKDLYGYTMVPMKEYTDDTGDRVNVNEHDLVHETAMFLGNVKEHYETLDEINCWDCLKPQLDLLEGPFKSLQNVAMLKALAVKAYRDGCRIILNGQLGNDTISYGEQNWYIYELFATLRWRELWRELHRHSAFYRYKPKKMIRQIFHMMFRKHEKGDYNHFLETTWVKEYSKKQYDKTLIDENIKTRKEYMPFIMDRMRFRQIGDNETRLSLASGVLSKDPTRDIAFFEWCLSLPTEQFNKSCTNRRLVYAYMAPYLPKAILDQRLPKGRQSADTYFRLKQRKMEIYNVLKETFQREHPYLRNDRILESLESHKAIFEKEGWEPEERGIFDRFLCARELYLLYDKYFS